jgi:ABC-type sugar transport system substrate-binding protein
MVDSTNRPDGTRRKYLKTIGAGGLAVATGLTGCVGGGGSGGNSSSKGNGSAGVIGVAMKSLGAFFFRTCAESAQYQSEQLGYEADVVGAGGDSEELNRQISALTQRGNISAIITDPNNSEAQQQPISSAMDEGIPVGVIDTPPASEATITVAFDNYLAGEQAAREAVSELEAKYDSLEGLNVVSFHGFLGSYAWNQRMKGVRDYMKPAAEEQGFNFYNIQGGSSPEEFASSALEWFSQQDSVAAAINASSGGFMAGVLRALDQEGMLYYRGHEEHVLVGAVYGYLSDVTWIENGYIDFISVQNAVAYGQVVVDLLDQYAIGEDARDVMPLNENLNVDANRFYYGEALGESPQIESMEFGPKYTVPTYIMDEGNVGSNMHWPKLARDRLGMESEAAGLEVSPQGTPPSSSNSSNSSN